MSAISQKYHVANEWKKTKGWCDAFFFGWEYFKNENKWINKKPTYFFEYIRKEHNINMLSESEYLNAHREELIKSGCKEIETPLADPFDFSKITVNKIVDTKTALLD